jgi:hypothetical protein
MNVCRGLNRRFKVERIFLNQDFPATKRWKIWCHFSA